MENEKEKRKNTSEQPAQQRRVVVAIAMAGVLMFGAIAALFVGESASTTDACGGLPVSQISIGDTVQAQITDPFAETVELYIYERPNAGQRLGMINDSDTALVIAGAHCSVDNDSSGRYWRIQTEDGIQGWVMEIATFTEGYLLLPVSE